MAKAFSTFMPVSLQPPNASAVTGENQCFALDTEFAASRAGDTRLRPGMLLAAEIILESRSLIDWLLEPIRLRQKRAA